ncbi:MAG: hypothetical protein IBX50_09720 [Marinospirillum sp.]|uniref:hypothetical protein n=1 Tax=Marinospirillum sp. TaxID=2183934 RepID=UPI0019E4BC17|nr:hypothetical protein [Marinospirillum sp.]MBE0506980.1 hypothetical protein [Marinospirillum sp.]
MAQLNIRISDAEKEIAERAAQAAGFSLREYLGTIIKYIAMERTLPVVVMFKPVAIEPEELFQQAIEKYRHAYLAINHLYEQVLVEGEMTPLELLEQPIDAVAAAEEFYTTYKNQITLAPGQLEEITISDTESTMFASCREHFPYIPGFLRTAIRMVNMNNRSINRQDLADMREALQQAANHINTLQGMIRCQVSADAHCEFFINSVKYAVECASRATKPNEAYVVCTAWQSRMNRYIREAEIEFQNLGIIPHLRELELIWKQLGTLSEAVHQYLANTSEPMQGFNENIIVELKELLFSWKCRTAQLEKQ